MTTVIVALGAAVAIGVGCSESKPETRTEASETVGARERISKPATLAGASSFHASRAGFETVHRALYARVAPRGELAVTPMGRPFTFQLETVSAAREAKDVAPVTSTMATLERNGVVERSLGHVVERIEAVDEGIETSWTLQERPSGSGDFVVRQRVLGSVPPEQSPSGLLFRREGIRIGHGTFVDGAHRQTVVPVSWGQGELVYRVPAELLERAQFPAVLDPLISVEGELDSTAKEGTASQRTPVNVTGTFAAASGTNFYVAWMDTRSLIPKVMGALVDSAGGFVHPPTELASAPLGGGIARFFSYGSIRVVAGAGGFLVQWAVPQESSFYQVKTVGIRVGADGTRKDAEPIDFGVLSDSVAVSVSGDAFYVINRAALTATESGLSVTRVAGLSSASPNPVTYKLPVKVNYPDYLRSFAAVGDRLLYSVTPGGGGGGVVQEDLYSTSLLQTNQAAPLKLSPIASGYMHSFSLSGERIVVFGSPASNDGSPYLARVLDADGVTLGPQVSLGAFAPYEARGDAAGFVVRGGDGGPGKICRYSVSMAPIGTCYTVPLFGGNSVFALGQNSLAYFSALGSQVRGAVPTLLFYDRETGLSNASRILPVSVNGQTAPRIIYDPTAAAYLGVWVDDSAADDPVVSAADGGAGGTGGLQLRGAIVRAVGDRFEVSSPFALSSLGANALRDPILTLDGGSIRAAWVEQRSVQGKLLNRIVSETVGIPATGAAPSVGAPVALVSSESLSLSSPTIAADGAGWLLSWIETGSGGSSIRVKRVPSGNLTPDEIASTALVTVGSDQSLSDVTSVFDGKQTIVAWCETSLISGRVAATVFSVGGSTPTGATFTVDEAFSGKESLRLATDQQTGTFAVWASANFRGYRDVVGRMLPRENPVPDLSIPSLHLTETVSQDEFEPAVAYSNDEETYFAAWSSTNTSGSDADLRGAWVSTAGRILDPDPGVVVSATLASRVAAADGGREDLAEGEDEGTPALATGPVSVAGLLYVRADSRLNGAPLRARFRTAYSGKKSGEVCSVSGECASRYCVDGVCCKSACDDGCGQCGGTGGSKPGTCAPRAAATVCGPASRYLCSGDSVTCPELCEGDGQGVCAPGVSCVDRLCVLRGGSCFDDYNVNSDRGVESCGAYRCLDGACRAACETVEDCAVGAVCTFDGRCEPPPPVENTPGGCSVSGPSSRTGLYVGLLVAGALGWASRLRRRKGVRATL